MRVRRGSGAAHYELRNLSQRTLRSHNHSQFEVCGVSRRANRTTGGSRIPIWIDPVKPAISITFTAYENRLRMITERRQKPTIKGRHIRMTSELG